MKTFDDDFGWEGTDRVPVEDFRYPDEPEGEGQGAETDFKALVELSAKLLCYILTDRHPQRTYERAVLTASLLAPGLLGHPDLSELGRLLGCSKATASRKLTAARAALLSAGETQKRNFPKKNRILS